MKLFKAFGKVTVHHLLLIIVSIFLVAPFGIFATKFPVIFSLITGIIYICTMYSLGWIFGYRDSRNLPGYTPDKSFPIKVSLLCAIIPIILIILMIFCPDILKVSFPVANGDMDFFITGNRFHGICDMLCKIWFFPFGAFLRNNNAIAFIIILILQPVCLYTGYVVGLTRFSIRDKLTSFIIFDKKK